MHTSVCDSLGIEFPIFAFTHCRDVVAAVSNAGGFGVLGAVGFSAEQLATELAWLDEHCDKPYGVDVVIPGKYEGMGELDPVKLENELQTMIPEEHREFAKQLLADHGVPELPESEVAPALLGWTEATASPLIDEALQHDKVRLIANALGTPP
jgi:NAD(P)H-dependent flavin oxidoreductase YrpB (nitropropane dioxygenase family)